MSDVSYPSQALAALLEQHDQLRALADACETLADQLDDGAAVAGDLAREVARLRIAFDAHNKYEESILKPLLVAADAYGPVNVERMVDEHVREHGLVRSTLGGPRVGDLRPVLGRLRQHLADEERYFLTLRVLRDDLIVIEPSS